MFQKVSMQPDNYGSHDVKQVGSFLRFLEMFGSKLCCHNFARSEVAEDLADGGDAPLTWKNKVKIARMRTHINGLHSAVKDKENVVARCRFVSTLLLLCV